ncbi:MAG TPA: ElyC/SanA/YdcF family protein [Bacteroidales bacterium]|nr:ElyC/SanA/YdcF family protein [Bacteroidales bacterium]
MKKLIKISLLAILILGIFYFSANAYIQHSAKAYTVTDINKVPSKYTCIVLGALVGNDGTPSIVLADRLDAALNLYRNGKVKRFLLTGDHGRINYDEVNNMKRYLEERGVPQQDIFLDHAGFDTYNSMVRAKEIFLVKDAIIVTQEFHISRSIYIARKKGIDAYGFSATMSDTKPLHYLKFRESIACLKAFGEVVINRSPKFLGTKIPITGDSRLSYD